MRSKSNGRTLRIVYLVIGLIIVSMILYAKWGNEKFRQEIKKALNISHTIIYVEDLYGGKEQIMEEEIAIYNKEQEENPEMQYVSYRLEKGKYILISYFSFLHDLARLKVDMLNAIRDMSKYGGEEIYEFSFVYATKEQKDLYEFVMKEFEGVRETFNFQEVKQEGEEVTIVIVSFINPFMGTTISVPIFLYLATF